ncbi:cellulose biosynthesis cyclic di-GMP-binding regulatory protein BcsB [Pinisolibacter sp.]|uniref:cellulose biosynthesis cyclic di-GMP-binding regulatory protein BcsB n=1 Tax=Pinisolibacter sp. TaxID=2172024 RepID=UPI002FDDDDB0
MTIRFASSVILATLGALAFGAVSTRAGELPTTLEGLSAATSVDARVLRRLPSTMRSTRLTGETDALAFPVWLTPSEAAGGVTLRLAHVAAVSVMPEASRLTVAVNDRTLSDVAIGAGGGARSTEITVPGGVLRPGWNAVRIGVDQRHRVDCSVASTWELWTEIDRARSGFVFPAGHRPERRGIADIAGIAPDENGRVTIRLVSPGEPEPHQLERAVRAAEALALIGGFLDPVVTVTRKPETAPGLDVMVGRAAATLDGEVATLQAGSIAVLDDGATDRLAVVIPGSDAEVDRALERLTELAGRPTEGSEAGLAARTAVGGRAIASGERVQLAELGVASKEFNGRLFRVGFDLRLPADLYPADYAKVQLKLAGGLAPGLDRAARLTVRVDGQQAAGQPLVAPNGEVFEGRTLSIPLSAFKPGHNRVEIEAAVPAAADKTCDPAVQIDGAKRFLFVDRSELVFPNFARLARLPDLAATASGVLGRLSPDARPTLYVPHPDLAALSAAATFATRIAVAAGRVEAQPIVFRNPAVDAPSAVVVGALADLPATVVGAVGLEIGQVRAAWARRPNDQQATVTPTRGASALVRRVAGLSAAVSIADVDPIVTGSLQGRVLTALPARDGDLVDRWRRSMESPWSPAAFGRQAGVRFEKLFDYLPAFGATRSLEGFAPTPSTGLVIAQAMSPAGGAWTLVTAPSSAVLAETIATVVAGEDWARLRGAAASWDRVEEKVTTVPAGHVGFLATADLDFANFRLVAAALASDYPYGYILAAFLVTAALGFATARLLPRLGSVKS